MEHNALHSATQLDLFNQNNESKASWNDSGMKGYARTEKKFSVGMVVITPGAASLLVERGIHTRDIIKRHQSGDWGEIYPEDCSLNDDAVRYGHRILSVYKLGDADRLWVITEADRSSTTLLLPSDY